MFYGLGEMTDAMEKGREKRDAKRLENARLYKEFVSSNPGATTQERLDFANNLIKTTGAGSAGLPTRVQMERNYQKHQAAQARAAAGRARSARRAELAERRQAMRDATMLGTNLASSFGSEGFNEMVAEQAEAFGIPEAFIPGIAQTAGDTAYQNWAQNNQVSINAYLQNPTRAGYEVLSTAPGATNFTGRLSGAYEGAYKTAEANQVIELNNQLLDLSQTSNLEDYEKARANLLRGVPSSVSDQLDLDTYNQTFSRRQAEAQTVATQSAQNEFSAYLRSLGTSATQADADRKMAEIINKYSIGSVSVSANDFSEANAYLAEQLRLGETQTQANIANAIRNSSELIARVADGEMTLDEAYAALEDGTLSGIKPEYQMTPADQQLFQQGRDALVESRAADDNSAANISVLDADVSDVALGKMSLDDVVNSIEARLREGQGREVTLSETQIAGLGKAIEVAREDLNRRISDAASGMVSDPAAIQGVSQSTQDQFVEQFISLASQNLDVNTTDEGMRAKLTTSAIATYNQMVAEIRQRANRQEEQTAQAAVNSIFTAVPISSEMDKDVASALGASLESIAIIGDGTDDGAIAPGVLKDNYVTDVSRMLKNVASEYGIPVTPELATMVVDEFKGTFLSIRGMEDFVPGQVIEQSSITSSFEAVIEDYLPVAPNLSYGSIRAAALKEAMAVAGANSLSRMDLNQRTEFVTAYRSAVERLAEEKYDILAETPAEDLAPTQEIRETFSPFQEQGEVTMASFKSLVGMGELMFKQGVDSAPFVEAKALAEEMRSADTAITSEILRLTNLAQSNIYTPSNPTMIDTINTNIQELQTTREEILGHLREYDAAKVTFDALLDAQLAREAEYESRGASEEVKVQGLQDEIDAAGPSHRGGPPLGLSPEARALWEEQNRERISESNSNFWTSIFGPGRNGDGPAGIAKVGSGQ